MKSSNVFKIIFYLQLIFLTSCIETNSQNNSQKKLNQSEVMNIHQNPFTGKFISTYENSDISADLIENQNVVIGYIQIDGINNELKATSENNTFKGKILDIQKNIYYHVTAILKEDILHLSITFPELDQKVVDILLKKSLPTDLNKSTTSNHDHPTDNKNRDERLIGTWRYTEILSSGGFGDNTSLATDYFLQFKSNGECLSWIGSSAGGSADVTYENTEKGNVDVERWYTEGKNVIFYDLNTHKEVSIPFLADETRFLLKGGSTKIYERVN